MIKRRDFIRALAVISAAALVSVMAARSTEAYLEHGGNVPPCRHEEPVDRVRDLSLDAPQSTVRWVHAEQELWVCHGREGCMWAPLFHDDCRQRREDR